MTPPTFKLVQLFSHNQYGTNPNNLPLHTLVPPSALTGVPHPHNPPVTSPTQGPHTRRSTTDRLYTQAHTDLTPMGPLGFGPIPPECAQAQEIADPALIPIVGPKTRRVGPTGRTPGGSLTTPQKLAQEVRDSPHFYVGSTLPHNQCGTNPKIYVYVV